ncbi:hypothetical protein ILUMI_10446 [Ignelater luminosus]|uniref:C-type lectin domain-containing protein n=1 Tax=Ignelater luminosus TaxID=2038154 RepID=A0A8K0D2F8_IGNLU|nr:hypothetical protein ILUMI_10446 [Ignelater luminosus]
MVTAKFLADALSETNVKTDSLWVGAQFSIRKNVWEWKLKVKQREVISPEVNKTMKVNPDRHIERGCLAFARLQHDKPELRPLACTAFRGYICENDRVGTGEEESTHTSWIRIGDRLYKIFVDACPYDEVPRRCLRHDPEALPAVVASYKAAQALGRYMLIGRPSIENAWIGARYYGVFQYYFENENVILSNQTDPKTGYPPWRNNTMQRPGGCILLDRHLGNITYFVEARCQRFRPYICYKKIDNVTGNVSTVDIIFRERGYRLHFLAVPWIEAFHYCSSKYKGASLVEIKNNVMVQELLFVMGENRSAIQHIWLGGVYKQPEEAWFWASDNKTLVDLGLVNILGNKTDRKWIFTYEVEIDNMCLNMDRENHITALFYGTQCNARQYFACLFTADDLRAQQKLDVEKQR